MSVLEYWTPLTRIPILLNPYTFLSGYAFCPHASAESDLRIRKRVNPLSIVESFESDIFPDKCGQSNPDTFESDDVARSGPISTHYTTTTVVSTAWLQNNMAAKRSCCSCWADFKPRNMCSVKRSYVDCAFKLCRVMFDNSVSRKVVEEAWRENYNSSKNSK